MHRRAATEQGWISCMMIRENSLPWSTMENDIFTRKIIVNYYNSATVGIYRQWCKDGKKLSLDHVIELATGLIQNGLKSII